MVPPTQRIVIVPVRKIAAGGPEYPGDHGGLRQVQIRRTLVEIQLGRRLHPIHASVSQVELVAVHGQDFTLGVALLQLDGQDHLLELAPDGLFGVQVESFNELLADGAAALQLVGRKYEPDVLFEGPQHAQEIDPVVVVETRVFGRDNGVFQVVGDIGQGDLDPLFQRVLTHHRAVVGIDIRDDPRLEFGQLGDVGKVGHDGPENTDRGPQPAGRHKQEHQKSGLEELFPVLDGQAQLGPFGLFKRKFRDPYDQLFFLGHQMSTIAKFPGTVY